MRKTSLLVVAVAATGLLWCLDRTVGSADATEDCVCETIIITGEIGVDGMYKTTLPPEAVPVENELPWLQVYQQSGNAWETIGFETYHGNGGIIVRGEPGARLTIVALRVH